MHRIEVTITPICTSCGAELKTHGCQSLPSTNPFERDWPGGRKDQRVFVEACDACYVHKSDIPGTTEQEVKAAS